VGNRAAIALGVVVWLVFLFPSRRYSHDGIGDFVAALYIGAAIAIAGAVALGARESSKGYTSRWLPLFVVALLPSAAIFAYSRLDSVRDGGRWEKYGMEAFHQYTHRFPHGIASASVRWRGHDFTESGRSLMLICGYRTVEIDGTVGADQSRQFCAVVDLLASPQVIGGYKRQDYAPPEIYGCFGIVKAECSFYADLARE
jgi:hypothetical protein